MSKRLSIFLNNKEQVHVQNFYAPAVQCKTHFQKACSGQWFTHRTTQMNVNTMLFYNYETTVTTKEHGNTELL